MSIIKNLRNVFKHVPKKLAVTFGALAAVLIPTMLFAWGPADRETFTIEKPATYVTFNSITNNPNHGDERNFTSAKQVNEGSSAWRDVINVTGNDEYSINVYVHNNAAANLGLVATNTRAQVTWDTGESKQIQLDGVISADNATPSKIWDQVIFKSESQEFKLVYVAGSAKYYNNVNPSTGFAIGDNVVKAGGALIGYNAMDGKVPGCFEYSGILNIKVRTVMAVEDDFTMEKKVRLDGDSEWSDTITAEPGQKVNYQISYKNTGDLIQSNVTVRDQLPNGVAYNAGTTTLRNGTYNQGNGMTLNSDNIISTGVNIGSYTAGAAAYTRFTATMPSEDELECGVNTLVNKGFVTASGTTKDDTATVTITKECPEPEKEFTCDRLNINPVTRTSFDFTTDYTIVNTTYNNISYVISGNNIYDARTSTAVNGALSYSQLVPGTYKVVATLNTADGSNTNANCEGTITVEPDDEPSEAICRVLTANPLAIKTGDVVNFRVYPGYVGDVQVVGSYINFGDGVTTNPSNTLRYSHIYTTEGQYKVKAYVNFIVDGKEVNGVSSVECEKTITVTETPPEHCPIPGKEHLPIDDPGCKEDEEFCPIPGKEHLPKDDPGCKEDEEWCPVPGKEHLKPNDPDCVSDVVPGNGGPTYLPKTGLEVLGILGLGSMTTAGAYYVASRRGLNK